MRNDVWRRVAKMPKCVIGAQSCRMCAYILYIYIHMCLSVGACIYVCNAWFAAAPPSAIVVKITWKPWVQKKKEINNDANAFDRLSSVLCRRRTTPHFVVIILWNMSKYAPTASRRRDITCVGTMVMLCWIVLWRWIKSGWLQFSIFVAQFRALAVEKIFFFRSFLLFYVLSSILKSNFLFSSRLYWDKKYYSSIVSSF